jgi:hypothetical protein
LRLREPPAEIVGIGSEYFDTGKVLIDSFYQIPRRAPRTSLFHHPMVQKLFFKIVNFTIGALPFRVLDEMLDPLHQDPSISAAVEFLARDLLTQLGSLEHGCEPFDGLCDKAMTPDAMPQQSDKRWIVRLDCAKTWRT